MEKEPWQEREFLAYMRKTLNPNISIRGDRPAVNVKIRGFNLMENAISQIMAEEDRNPRFSDFYESLSEEEREEAWNWAITIGWERLQDIADDIFPTKATVYSEGRSGGWAVVDGLEDIGEWGEEDHARWAEFEKLARATADDIPYLTLSSLYGNEFTDLLEEEERQAARFIVDLEANNYQLVNE